MTKIQLMGLFGINKAKNSADPAIKRKTAGGLPLSQSSEPS